MLKNGTIVVTLVVLGSLLLLTASTSHGQVSPAAEPLLSQIQQLVTQGERSGEGYFSADGQTLIFQSEGVVDNPFYQIFMMDLSSRSQRLISTGLGKTTCAWLHPLQQKALFASTHEDPQARQKQDDEWQRRQSGQPRNYAWDYDPYYEIYEKDLGANGTLRNLTSSWGYDAEGSWSPDGQHLLFASNRHGFTEKLTPDQAAHFTRDPSLMIELYMMKADGSQLRRLTQNLGYDGGPFFSADGRKITWRRFDPSGRSAEIMVMELDAQLQPQREVALTQSGALSWAPYFHPSGEYLIFSSNQVAANNFELFIVATSGGPAQRVTHRAGFDGLAVFSPDGQSVAWSSQRTSNGKSQLFLAQWDHLAALRALGLRP